MKLVYIREFISYEVLILTLFKSTYAMISIRWMNITMVLLKQNEKT